MAKLLGIDDSKTQLALLTTPYLNDYNHQLETKFMSQPRFRRAMEEGNFDLLAFDLRLPDIEL